MYIYFKRIGGVGNGNYIYYWQSKGLSDEKINSIAASSSGVVPFLDYYGTKTRVEFSGSCLKQDQVTFSWHWIRQKCNDFWSRHEFINKD